VVPFCLLIWKRYFGTKSCSVYVIGFGYDCVRDDYKVFRIAQFGGGGRGVLSLRLRFIVWGSNRGGGLVICLSDDE
jgi:hypothetical protein